MPAVTLKYEWLAYLECILDMTALVLHACHMCTVLYIMFKLQCVSV